MDEVCTKQSLTLSAAEKMIAAGKEKASEIGVPMVIAAVDESGTLKSFVRMDGAQLLSVEIAQNKAYTSVSFGLPTHEWYEFIKNDPPLLIGIVHHPRLIVYGGGYPIKINGNVVGGIGVSGGHYTQDMEVAKAMLGVLEGVESVY
jgi:uncharacterized protein GlcG (DUF336 family)